MEKLGIAKIISDQTEKSAVYYVYTYTKYRVCSFPLLTKMSVLYIVYYYRRVQKCAPCLELRERIVISSTFKHFIEV